MSNHNEEDLLLFKQFVTKHYGVLISNDNQQAVMAELAKLLKTHNINDLRELMLRLQQAHEIALRNAVLAIVTINETFWCRDQHPFEILKKIILPEIHRRQPMDKLRIWSAACSYGQEPYSISMVVEETKRMHPTYFVAGTEIMATDICQSVIDRAQKGEYEASELVRGLPDEWWYLFFDELPNNSGRVKDKIKKNIQFKVFNLLDNYLWLGKFDVIFCRNVLVYFSPETKLDVLRRMHAALKPGGYLIVGATEMVTGVNDYYQIMQCNPGIVYRAINRLAV